MPSPSLIVHGGAGRFADDDVEGCHRRLSPGGAHRLGRLAKRRLGPRGRRGRRARWKMIRRSTPGAVRIPTPTAKLNWVRSPWMGSTELAEVGAASAAGGGESLVKIVISKSACDLMLSGQTAPAAAEAAIERLAERVNGSGGIIGSDAQGRAGCASNTPRLPRARITADGEIETLC